MYNIKCKNCGIISQRENYNCSYCLGCKEEKRKITQRKNYDLRKDDHNFKLRRKEYLSNYTKNNKDKLRELHKRWIEEHKDLEDFKQKIREYKEKYRSENRELLNRKNREYREKNKEEFNEKQRAYNKLKKEKFKPNFVECACGCKRLIREQDYKGRKNKYLVGHSTKNKPHTIDWLKKQSEFMKGKHIFPFRTINCEICKKEVNSNSPSRLYCDDCSIKVHKIKENERNLKNIGINRKRRNFYLKNKREKDKNYNIAVKLRGCLTKALKIYSISGKIKDSKEYGVDYKAIIEHLKPFPKDISKYHIDHIKPLCSFDLNNQEQIKSAFAPENHQWLLAEQNLSKAGRDRLLSIRRNQNE
ncbi:MAG: hypothetical protein AABY22_23260 [Nanoarchaeota archaeon]